MHIDEPRLTTIGGHRRLVATVRWETIARPPQDIWFEVPEEHGDSLATTGDAFLAGASVLATRVGEERLRVVGACPELAEGVRTALSWLRLWYPEVTSPLEVETTDHRPHDPSGRVAGSLLSGGIDSMAVLRRNHQRLPPQHPARIEACILVDWSAGSDREVDRAASAAIRAKRESIRGLTDHAGVPLIPLASNLLSLDGYPRAPWWARLLHGAAFAGAAHALGGGLHTVYIGASYDIPNLKPWGSHPLIDSNFRSGYLDFVHDGVRLSRFERTAAVAAWPEALRVVNVCIANYETRAREGNCGRCEKCVRTAVTLLALGKFTDAESFDDVSIDPRTVERIRIASDVVAAHWADLAIRLRDADLDALADLADQKVRSYRRRRRLTAADRVVTRGRLTNVVRRARRR